MDLEPESDLQLVTSARDGSREAFARLVSLHQAKVRAFLGRFLRNPDAVDDVAQDTFLDAYRKLASYRGEASVRSWLLGIARNCALRYLRDEQPHFKNLDSLFSDWASHALEERPATADEQDRELDALKTCVGGLPEFSTRVLEAFYSRGRSALEIAKDSGQNESAIWKTLSRIRQALRRCMEQRLQSASAV